MAKKTLVSPDIDFGSDIIRSLEEANFTFSVALWSLNDEAEEYELVIGTQVYDKEGPKQAYTKLLAALSGLNQRIVNSLRIRLLGNKSPLIRALRKQFGKTASVEGMRLGGHSIAGVWLDDAYVYRIK